MLTQMSTCGWMRDIWSVGNDGFIEDLGPDGRHQDGVDSTQLHVDLEAEIGEGLWGGFVDIFSLHALCPYSQDEQDQLCVKK